MSPARPLAQLRTQCPYCDHVSPADSKFCNECGAALHLMPCPHCGAVNDLTLTAVCARCNGDLQAAPAAAAPIAPRSEKPPATLTLVTEPMPDTAEPPLQAPAAARPPWGVWGAALLLGLAGLGYYAYTPEPGPEPGPAPANVVKPAPAAVLAKPAPEPVVQEAALPPPADASSKPVTSPKAKPARISPPPAATTAAATSTAPEPAPRPRNTPEPPPPRIGPCTDAVAALGLCNAESPNRKQ